MVSTVTFHDARRSTRVPLKVIIAIEGGAESRTCEGETIVVNLHGALIATAMSVTRAEIGSSGGNVSGDVSGIQPWERCFLPRARPSSSLTRPSAK